MYFGLVTSPQENLAWRLEYGTERLTSEARVAHRNGLHYCRTLRLARGRDAEHLLLAIMRARIPRS